MVSNSNKNRKREEKGNKDNKSFKDKSSEKHTGVCWKKSKGQ